MRQHTCRPRLQLALSPFLLLVLTSSFTIAGAQTRQPVTPFLDEVTINPTTGLGTAYFGYNNPNTTTVTIHIGQPTNFFFQPPEVRGQPEQFIPGLHHYAFASIFNYQLQPNLTWIVDGSQATASAATALPQPQTSIFTYQGHLTDGTTAANGTYEMKFALYDAATGGTQIGSTVTNTNVNVSAGVFTVPIDFGPGPFNPGGDRYLEISIRHHGDTTYTTLSPRQQLTAAPFAIHTISAGAADSLSNACAGCVTNAQIGSVAGNKVTGSVPNADNATSATTATTAGSVSGVVAIGNGGTGSSAQNFVDLSTNQSNIGGNKTFTGVLNGTFNGDGSGLSNVRGTLAWQTVPGTSQQAQPNTGYLLTNTNQATITLPANPHVGDIVRVSGVGSGGWRLAQNAGQLILGVHLNLYDNWSARDSNRNWTSVASSADGSKLVAVAQPDFIYTSTDSGASWTARATSLGHRGWVGVASSADGTKLAAVVLNGQIYTSSNSGITWTARENNRAWMAIASSADGTKLVAVVFGGHIYTSTDSGASWTERQSNVFADWLGVASSADGSKLFAAVGGSTIKVSNDSGATWAFQDIDTAAKAASIASSADGTKLVTVGPGSRIYTSTDSGNSWTARESSRSWGAIASSTDGSQLVATIVAGQIYTSADSGVSWTARESNRSWQAVASSADGSKLVAVVNGGQIYTSSSRTTLGTAGYLLGGPYTAIELQYLGGGQFFPLSHEGTILGH